MKGSRRSRPACLGARAWEGGARRRRAVRSRDRTVMLTHKLVHLACLLGSSSVHKPAPEARTGHITHRARILSLCSAARRHMLAEHGRRRQQTLRPVCKPAVPLPPPSCTESRLHALCPSLVHASRPTTWRHVSRGSERFGGALANEGGRKHAHAGCRGAPRPKPRGGPPPSPGGPPR